MVRLKNLTAGYGKRPVVQGVTLEFAPGKVTVLSGPNGSGKSTLLKAALGLLPLLSGEVLYDDVDIRHLKRRQIARKAAFLTQSRNTPSIQALPMVLHGRFPWLTYPRRYDRKDYAMARHAMEATDTLRHETANVSHLSGGERQGVYLAMALAQDTPTLFFFYPADKLRIVRAFKKRGDIVTMTGDGVNDAPAVKEASIGVAMGITGTDVTKQAADVVLLDDNFATLVGAVEQGRGVYANIRKFVRYLLSCNIGEVLTMFLGIIMGMPMVLLPTQILLVNLVTDGLPAVALGVEPPEKENMKKPPRRSDESFFSDGLMQKIIFRGVLIGLCTLGSFTAVNILTGSVSAARTAALFTLVMSQLFHVFECKSERKNIFTVPYGNNKKLILAVMVSVAVIFAALYLPWLQVIFCTVPLTGKQLLIGLGFAVFAPLLQCILK